MSKRVWVGIVVVAGIVGAASMAFAVGTLDGKTFSGTIGKQGETKGMEDHFVFKNGQFESTLCEQFGYGAGAYTTAMVGDGVRFTAETTSKAGGKKDWTGTVTVGRIKGSVVTTENGSTSEMWFNGNIKTD